MGRRRFFVLFLIIGLIGCAINPVTGKKELSLISENQELALGKQTDVEIRQQYGVYGDDPRQGYVEGPAFYHPELAFSFVIPSGWKVVNTPAQVIISSPDEKAALLLQAENTEAELPSYAEKRAADITGSQFVRADQIQVPGLASYHPLYRVSQQDSGALSLRLSVIRKGAYIYTFSALASESDFSGYESTFRQTAQSFTNLTDPALLGRKPSQIKLVEASGRQALQDIFSGAGVKKDVWPALAILNGMELGARPPQGKMVKIVR